MSVKKALELIKAQDAKYVDFRFTDPLGQWQHLAHHISTIDEDLLTEGVMFDGSSIAGWKAINESDMLLKPDCATAVLDPFAAQPTVIIYCDILEPLTGQNYGRDPRSIAKKAEAFVKNSGIGDTVYVGPEAEFFVFRRRALRSHHAEDLCPIHLGRGALRHGQEIRRGQSRPPHEDQGRLLPGRPARLRR